MVPGRIKPDPKPRCPAPIVTQLDPEPSQADRPDGESDPWVVACRHLADSQSRGNRLGGLAVRALQLITQVVQQQRRHVVQEHTRSLDFSVLLRSALFEIA